MNLCYRCHILLKNLYIKNEWFSTSCYLAERQMLLFKKEHNDLLKKQPNLNKDLKSLKIAIIGAPNAGKSLLTNQLVAWKFAPVSNKVHTTRFRMIGIHTEGDNQLIFIDTPGIIRPSSLKKHNLERSLLIDPHAALFDSDLISVVVDVSHIWHRMRLDTNLLQLLHYHKDKPSILILNKVDLLKHKTELLDVTRRLTCGCINGQSFLKPEQKNITPEDIIQKFKSHNLSTMNKIIKNEDEIVGKSYEYDDLYNRNITELTDDINDYNVNDENKYSQLNGISNHESSKIFEVNELIVKKNINTEPGLTNTINCIEKIPNCLDLHKQYFQLENKITNSTNLNNSEKWKEYYSSLQKLTPNHQNGWPLFSEVFMISALTGDGIFELKNYLSSKTFKCDWKYDPSVVTNIGPLELARLCIREKILDNVPSDVAHGVEIRMIMWEISPTDNLLRARFDIVCKRKRQSKLIMGSGGSTIQHISRQAKQSLMNAFRREMSLQLVIKYYEDEKQR